MATPIAPHAHSRRSFRMNRGSRAESDVSMLMGLHHGVWWMRDESTPMGSQTHAVTASQHHICPGPRNPLGTSADP